MTKTFKRILAIIICIVTVLSLSFTNVSAAQLTQLQLTSNGSSNKLPRGTGRWASVKGSYIYKQGNNYVIVDAEYTDTDYVVITTYNKNFSKISEKKITCELPIFGGFFSGSVYNYMVFGKNNTAESTTAEVYRIVKYDKNFNVVSRASIVGSQCHTVYPFEYGSLSMAEHDNELTIHTSRVRFTSDDGLRHQSQFTIILNTTTMTPTNSLELFQDNHVSHSFNQFVRYDSSKHVFVDHGDAYPRSVLLSQYAGKSSWGDDSYNEINLFKIPGETGANCTGVNIGGFEVSDNNYIVSINKVDHSKITEYTSFDMVGLDVDLRDIVLLISGKNNTSSENVKTVYLTDYTSNNKHGSSPYLVKISGNRFAVLWVEYAYKKPSGSSYYSYVENGVKYVIVDENGNKLTNIESLGDSVTLSDCQPICDNNKIIWYYDTNNGQRKICVLDLNSTTSYTLSYNANGGSGAPSNQTGSTTYTISSTVPTKFAHTFLGWSKSSSATSASYVGGNSITLTSNTTLYAVWGAPQTISTGITYSVNISSAGKYYYCKFTPSSSGTYIFESTGSVDSKAELYNSSGTSLQTNDDGGDNSNFKISYNLTSGNTYYIKLFAYSSKTGTYNFSVKKESSTTSYTVTYNANGGSVSPTSASVTSGSSVTLPTPTKSYRITYNANGGSGAPSAQTVSLSCKGWSTSSSATSASYSCGSSYKPTSNTTLYAVWNSSATATLSSTKPTRSGYTFLGWSTSSTASSASFSQGGSVTVSGNATLYAVWSKNPSTPTTPSDLITVSTSKLRLDTEEITMGFSTITLDDYCFDNNFKLVASSSIPDLVNLSFLESGLDNSYILAVETDGAVGKCTISVKVYNSNKTQLLDEETIEVEIKDTPYETIYLNYKDLYQLNLDGFNATSFETDNSSVATVDSEGRVRATGTGSTIIKAYDDADANVRQFNIVVDYTFWQWLIIIILFGWIWY